MFWAYILRCADGRYYIGHTDNLEHRTGAHQVGSVRLRLTNLIGQ